MKFTREPAVIIAVVAAALGLVVTFGLPWLTEQHAGLWIAAINAAAGLWTALKVRPFAPTAATYLASAAFALLAGYHFHVPDTTIGAVNVLIVAVVAAIVRPQSTPAASPQPIAPATGFTE